MPTASFCHVDVNGLYIFYRYSVFGHHSLGTCPPLFLSLSLHPNCVDVPELHPASLIRRKARNRRHIL
ncbi:hypothetical protein L1887_21538 [Cichorium endivia]|nr:hypothetical protein L1887_21538 [Cichorium endivia]